MTIDEFNKLLYELNNSANDTLYGKNEGQYAKGSEDKLHNFMAGAEISGMTPAQTCWGYLTKHLTALRDKVQRNDFSDRDDFMEKCQDSINYIRFLWLIGNAWLMQTEVKACGVQTEVKTRIVTHKEDFTDASI